MKETVFTAFSFHGLSRSHIADKNTARYLYLSQHSTMDIENILHSTNISGYMRQIETQEDWVSYRNPAYDVSSASLKEQRFNKHGEVAYYLASGVATAQKNVPGWQNMIQCRVSPHTINCFDLPRFSKDFGMEEEYLKSKSQGGYPLPQETANILLKDYGVTGVLYANAANPDEANQEYCIAVRPADGNFVDETFFVRK